MIATFLRAITEPVRRAIGPRCPAAGASDRRQVRLVVDPALDVPLTPDERLIVRALAVAGPVAVDKLASVVSHMVYRQVWGRGGWCADIGMLSSRVLAGDVARALVAGDGRLWTISPEGSEEEVREGSFVLRTAGSD